MGKKITQYQLKEFFVCAMAHLFCLCLLCNYYQIIGIFLSTWKMEKGKIIPLSLCFSQISWNILVYIPYLHPLLCGWSSKYAGVYTSSHPCYLFNHSSHPCLFPSIQELLILNHDFTLCSVKYKSTGEIVFSTFVMLADWILDASSSVHHQRDSLAGSIPPSIDKSEWRC